MAADVARDISQVDAERAARMPEAEKRDERDDGGGCGDDGDEGRVRISGHEILRGGEGDAGDEDRRPDFDHGAESRKDPDQPKGNHHVEGNEDRSGGTSEGQKTDAGDAVQRDKRNAHASECDRRGVREQRQAGGLKGPEAEADEDSRADGDGRAESRGALKERSEGESDEEKLQPAVGGDAGEAFLQRAKAAGLHGEVVEEDDGKDDPDNGKDTVTGAISGSGEGEPRRHVEDEHGGKQGGDESGERGGVRLEAQDGDSAEKDDDGQRGNESGEQKAAGGVVALRPVERGGIGFEEVNDASDEGEEGGGLDGEGQRRRRLD